MRIGGLLPALRHCQGGAVRCSDPAINRYGATASRMTTADRRVTPLCG